MIAHDLFQCSFPYSLPFFHADLSVPVPIETLQQEVTIFFPFLQEFPEVGFRIDFAARPAHSFEEADRIDTVPGMDAFLRIAVSPPAKQEYPSSSGAWPGRRAFRTAIPNVGFCRSNHGAFRVHDTLPGIILQKKQSIADSFFDRVPARVLAGSAIFFDFITVPDA